MRIRTWVPGALMRGGLKRIRPIEIAFSLVFGSSVRDESARPFLWKRSFWAWILAVARVAVASTYTRTPDIMPLSERFSDRALCPLDLGISEKKHNTILVRVFVRDLSDFF